MQHIQSPKHISTGERRSVPVADPLGHRGRVFLFFFPVGPHHVQPHDVGDTAQLPLPDPTVRLPAYRREGGTEGEGEGRRSVMMMMIIALKGAIRDVFYHLLTAPRTVSNTYAQVAKAQSCANHVQHVGRSSSVPRGTKGQPSYYV